MEPKKYRDVNDLEVYFVDIDQKAHFFWVHSEKKDVIAAHRNQKLMD